MLVNATEMLQKARDGHYAVGQFNINNLEWTKAALQAAQEMNSPIILGVSEGAGKYMTGFKTVAAMVKAMIDTLGIALIMLGLIIASGLTLLTLKLFLVVALLWVTSPVSSHLIARLEITTSEELDKHMEVKR